MQNFDDISAAFDRLNPEIQSLLIDSIVRIGELNTNELLRSVVVLAAIATGRTCDGMPDKNDSPESWQQFAIALSALLIAVASQQSNPFPEPHEVH